MIRITNKNSCCGCAACVQSCPKQCILMKEDEEGFFYPQVNYSSCIDCGLCEKVCPMLNTAKSHEPMTVYAAKNCNVGQRMKSSSGGMFIALAEYVIENGGVVFGAVYDEEWNVKIEYAREEEQLRKMIGSKYVQASVGNSYIMAKRFLQEGILVMFTGCSCQIAGLKSFLRKDYTNLFCVDLLCHGVPSPRAWTAYVEELQKAADKAAVGKNSVLHLSLNAMPLIEGIEFRNKTQYGWKKFSFVVRQKSAEKVDKNTVLVSDIHYKNPYMKGFLNNLFLRRSCYDCLFRRGESQSDMTIADFWGISKLFPDFDDDKGVSLVLVNTIKGKNMLDAIPLELRLSSYKEVKPLNGGFVEHSKMHPKRDVFFDSLIRLNFSFSKALNMALRLSASQRCKMLSKRCLRKSLRIMGLGNTSLYKSLSK